MRNFTLLIVLLLALSVGGSTALGQEVSFDDGTLVRIRLEHRDLDAQTQYLCLTTQADPADYPGATIFGMDSPFVGLYYPANLELPTLHISCADLDFSGPAFELVDSVYINDQFALDCQPGFAAYNPLGTGCELIE